MHDRVGSVEHGPAAIDVDHVQMLDPGPERMSVARMLHRSPRRDTTSVPIAPAAPVTTTSRLVT